MSGFPFLTNICSRTHISPPLSTTDSASPFRDTLLELSHDCLFPCLSYMHVCVEPTASSSLADGSANVCITNNPMLLVDVIDIDPIPLGMAVGNKSTSLFCTHKGFLSMPLLDSSIHYQPFLVCLDAMDTILSPGHIINNNHKFAYWCQEGSKIGLKNSHPHPGSSPSTTTIQICFFCFCLQRIKASIFVQIQPSFPTPPTIHPPPTRFPLLLSLAMIQNTTPWRHLCPKDNNSCLNSGISEWVVVVHGSWHNYPPC